YFGLGEGWGPNLILEPGEGAFLQLLDSGSTQLTFTGTRRTSPAPLPLVPSCQIVSLQVPEVGNYESIVQRSPVEGASVLRWNPSGQSFITNVFTNGSWCTFTNNSCQPASPPTAAVGEAWFLCLPTNAPPVTNCLSLVCAPDITVTNQPGLCSA